jgi:ATP-dependent exoDNAse (exonuclease V) beta subunit
VQELYNAVLQFEEENEDPSLLAFLANASLASDLDNMDEGNNRVSLMTLHSSKGLEFPVVFLVGLEQGLFPNFRSLEDPAATEEERRLCYVGITRAKERLFISYARERRLYGHREPASPSLFLGELPTDYVTTNSPGDAPTHDHPHSRCPPEKEAQPNRAAVPTSLTGRRGMWWCIRPMVRGKSPTFLGRATRFAWPSNSPIKGAKLLTPS